MHDPDNDVDFYFLRPKDIATYVGKGTLDLGITGRDMLVDSGAPVAEVIELGFGHSTFRLAAPRAPRQMAGNTDRHVLPGAAARSLVGAHRTLRPRWSSSTARWRTPWVSASPMRWPMSSTPGTRCGRPGWWCSGNHCLRSQALLVRPAHTDSNAAEETFVRRLQGVIVARAYVMVEYDITEELLDAAAAITPGLESPTVSPLREAGWVAVRAMVERIRVHQVMDELFELGGRAILVTDIHACRL